MTSYPPGTAPLTTRLGALEWSTNHVKAIDDGLGTALRNWESGVRSGTVDIAFTWAVQAHELASLHVLYAWRNFPSARLSSRGTAFDAGYLEGIWLNEAGQCKHLVIAAADVPQGAFMDPGTWGRPHLWGYAKLVGETGDGMLYDIRHWCLGSAVYRRDNGLPGLPCPIEQLLYVERPRGERDVKTRWEPYGDRWAPGHEPD